MMEENTALAEIDRAEQALQKASEMDDILNLRDQMAAVHVFANAQGFREAAQKAKIFQLKAERKAGTWLIENVEHGGPNPRLPDATLLPEGVDKNESFKWRQEASLPEERFNEWIDESLAKGWEITASGLRRTALIYNDKINPPEGRFLTPHQQAKELTLAMIYGAIDEHDKWLLSDDCRDCFEELKIPYDFVRNWASSGFIRVEELLKRILKKRLEEE